jgi:hypothetical protein
VRTLYLKMRWIHVWYVYVYGYAYCVYVCMSEYHLCLFFYR